MVICDIYGGYKPCPNEQIYTLSGKSSGMIQILFTTIESLPKWKTVLVLISLLLQLL